MIYRLQILHGSSYGLSNQSTKVQKYKTEKYKNIKMQKMQICKKMQKCKKHKKHKNYKSIKMKMNFLQEFLQEEPLAEPCSKNRSSVAQKWLSYEYICTSMQNLESIAQKLSELCSISLFYFCTFIVLYFLYFSYFCTLLFG